MKQEAWFGGAELNEVNRRRFMDKNEEIKKKIRDIFIEMNKGIASDENINMYCDKHNTIFYRDG